MKGKIFQVILIHLITLVYIKLKHEDIKNKYFIYINEDIEEINTRIVNFEKVC